MILFDVWEELEGPAEGRIWAGGSQPENDHPEEAGTHELLRARAAYQHPQGRAAFTQKVIFIKESFDLASPSFSRLAAHLELENHQIHEIVFRKGDKGEYFYIVLEGVYCVESENAKDRRKEKNIYYYPGDSFGEVSLIYDVPRGATIVANKDSALIRIPKQVFN